MGFTPSSKIPQDRTEKVIYFVALRSAVLVFLTLMVMIFTGWFGLVIFLISTPIGMIASFAKIRRTHAMG